MAMFYTIAFRQQAEKEFGARQATEVSKRAVATARRQLHSLPLNLHPAFGHIGEHFREVVRPAHGVFLARYHKPAELTKILLRAIDSPATEPMLSKSDSNDWAVVCQTWFGSSNPIGYSGGYAGAGPREDLTYLCLVIELNGDLITAYPTPRLRMPGNQV